jgi:hypothetical protein
MIVTLEISNTEIELLKHEGKVELLDYIRNGEERIIVTLVIKSDVIDVLI